MKTHSNILDALEKLFLASQTDIQEVREGSVIRAILFSTAAQLESLYSEIDRSVLNLYINKATDNYLDSLIEGFSGLRRRPETRSLGYVLVELGEALDDSNISKLSFSFSQYTSKTDTLSTEYNGSVKFLVAPEPNKRLTLTFIQPQSVPAEDVDFVPDPQTGTQPLFAQFKEFIRSIYLSTGKPTRYLVLPVATLETGSNTILKTGQVDTFINIGIPARIINIYLKKNANLMSVSIADADGISRLSTSPYNDSIFLGDFSTIAGGTDIETDDSYRTRYYAYMNSLSKGTIPAIKFGITNTFPTIDVQTINTSTPGEVDIVVFSKKPVTPNIVTSMERTLTEYRPVGIKLNIYTAKFLKISVLADITSTNFSTAVEKAKNTLRSITDTKNIGETLAYTDIHEGLDLPEIQYLDNVFYGLELNEQLFSLYQNTIHTALQLLLPTNSTASFSEYYQAVIDSPNNIVLFNYSAGHTGYPLLAFVRKAKQVPDPTALAASLNNIVSAIQACTPGVRDVECLENLGNSGTPLIITLQNVIDLVGPILGAYYKTKLLTLPNIHSLPASIAEPLIQKVLLNDIINLSQRELRPLNVHKFEKILLGVNPMISSGIYKNPELFGARNHEPID